MTKQTATNQTQTQVITGIAEHDRHYFQELNNHTTSLSAMSAPHVYRLDLHKIDRMNIITLGLIAWIQQEMKGSNRQLEIVNANSVTQDTLEMFELNA